MSSPDAEAIIGLLVNEGRLDRSGRGFVFCSPVLYGHLDIRLRIGHQEHCRHGAKTIFLRLQESMIEGRRHRLSSGRRRCRVGSGCEMKNIVGDEAKRIIQPKGRLYVRPRTDSINPPASTVFRLFGNNEDALSFAFGFTLSRSPAFTMAFLRDVGCIPKRTEEQTVFALLRNYNIILQERSKGKHGGVRDIVIEADSFRSVIEAKVDGSLPSESQILNYACLNTRSDEVDRAKHKKEWGRFSRRFIVTLTRSPVREGAYTSTADRLERVGITLLHATWVDLQRLIKGYISRNSESSVQELWKFIKEDYMMKHYEYEVICIHVTGITHDMTLAEPNGYYFASRKSLTAYPDCLYFCPVTGPSRSASRTGKVVRKIDAYEVLSANQILNRKDEMAEFFQKHCDRYPGDLQSERVHAFKLGTIIDIPEHKQKMTGSARFYKTMSELLGRD